MQDLHNSEESRYLPMVTHYEVNTGIPESKVVQKVRAAAGPLALGGRFGLGAASPSGLV